MPIRSTTPAALRALRPLLPLLLAGLSLPLAPSAEAQPVRSTVASPATVVPPLTLDPAVRTGRLANGLTYYVRRNAEPRNRAEMYLAINAGSALEDNDQRGLAHMLEHMLFNGTERFPKQDLVRYLESTGMRFGGDVNAYTSFDETVYNLTVPTDSARMYDRAFDVLRDWAGAALLDADEVDRERGVIVEEWRMRDQNAAGRVRNRSIAELLAGSRYATRLPIGDTATIRRAPAAALQRYYRDWYRPDLMAVIVVGDVDVAATVARIQREFGSLRNPARLRARPTIAAPALTGVRHVALTDAERPVTTVELTRRVPVRVVRTEAHVRASLVDRLVEAMMNQRLDELRRAEAAPFVGAGLYSQTLVRSAATQTSIVQVDPDRVEEGLAALLREGERARRFGFTASELDRQKAEILSFYERAFAERDRTPSARHASALVQSFLTGEVATSAEADLRLAQRLLPTLTLAEVNAAARQRFADGPRLVLFAGTDRPDKTELTSAGLRTLERRLAAQVRRERLTPYVDRPVATVLLDRAPAPGTVVSEQANATLGTTVLTLGNGLRVVVKPTTFKADEVVFTLTSPGGTSRVATADDYAATVASAVAMESGVGALDKAALDRLLAGKQVSVRPYVGPTDEGFSGSARPQDLETAFQLMHQYVAAPRFDPAALAAFKTQTRAALANQGATPVGALLDALPDALYGGHARARTNAQTLAALDALALADVERVYRDRFADLSGATLTLVGNVTLDDARRLATTYLGSIPDRRGPETFDASALPAYNAAPVDLKLYKGVAPQAFVLLAYTAPATASQEARQRLNALSSVLTVRLREKIREELAGVYSIQATGIIAERPHAESTVQIFFTTDPGRVDELTTAIRAEIEKIATDGPSVEEVTTAQEQQRRARQTGLEQNGYWLSTLDRAFAWPTGRPDEVLGTYEALIDATSGARLREDAQRYLGAAARPVRIVVLPEAMRPAN